MRYVVHHGVDAYLANLPDWQRDICQRLRDLAHEADPELEETVKRTVQPYFVLQGNVCALLATKDHVNLFLYDGGLAPDPYGIITSGHGNSTGRTIALHEGDPIPDGPLLELLRAVIADNRAGGWRRIKSNIRDASSSYRAGYEVGDSVSSEPESPAVSHVRRAVTRFRRT